MLGTIYFQEMTASFLCHVILVAFLTLVQNSPQSPSDNMSCKGISELRQLPHFPGYSYHSLPDKGVILKEVFKTLMDSTNYYLG